MVRMVLVNEKNEHMMLEDHVSAAGKGNIFVEIFWYHLLIIFWSMKIKILPKLTEKIHNSTDMDAFSNII